MHWQCHGLMGRAGCVMKGWLAWPLHPAGQAFSWGAPACSGLRLVVGDFEDSQAPVVQKLKARVKGGLDEWGE